MENSDSGVNVAVQQEVADDRGLMSEKDKQSEGAELFNGPLRGDPLCGGLCPQTRAFPDDAGEPGLGQVCSESEATLGEATVSQANEVSAPKVANDSVLLQLLQQMNRDNKERDRENKERDRDNKERWEAMNRDNKERDSENKERFEATKERLEAMDKGNKEAMRKLHTVIDERLSAVNNRLDEGEKNLNAVKQDCDAVKEKANNLEVRISAIESVTRLQSKSVATMENSDSGVNVAVQQEVADDRGLMSEKDKQSEGAELFNGPLRGDPLCGGLCPQTRAFPDDAGEPGLGQVCSESEATLGEATVSQANEVSAPKVANDSVLLQLLQQMNRDNKERDRENKERDRDNKERWEAMNRDNKERDSENKERFEATKERLEAMDKGNKEAMRKLHTVIDERLSAVNNRLDEGEKNLNAVKQDCDAVKEKANNLEVRISAIESGITERRDVLPDERIKEIVEDLLADKQGALEAQVTRQEVALNKHRDEVAETPEVANWLESSGARLEQRSALIAAAQMKNGVTPDAAALLVECAAAQKCLCLFGSVARPVEVSMFPGRGCALR
ncbi:DNA ligase 1-like [Schistocerca cancellata]|uniref:DNA ligase 1-like n=1 Tax=Schistocerca cancellata TaxID=274614 RepID=UPI0021186B3C|nr:DNA ligase 1-like [Schistocerca cancellata]